MERNLEVMKASVQLGLTENKSRSGLTGGDAAKLDHYIKTENSVRLHDSLLPEMLSQSMNTMPKWAWSALLLPLEVLAVCLPFSPLLLKIRPQPRATAGFLFAAGAFGPVIANNASISGAEGGCQAEVGSALLWSAAALTLAAGGTPYQASQAIAFVIKKYAGLICDPVAGLVEVPVSSAMPWELALPSSQQTWPWQVSNLKFLWMKLSMPCTAVGASINCLS